MSIARRLTFALATLCIALAAQVLLVRHLGAARRMHSVRLHAPLGQLPLKLGLWQGIDSKLDDPQLAYADEYLYRTYYHPPLQQTVTLWMAYSSTGMDREHHPQVCMSVAGKPEDKRRRRLLPMGDGGAPVQQSLFGRRGDQTWVFYWHYTLPVPHQGLDVLQRFHRRMAYRPGSLTVEVFAEERGRDELAAVQDFVRAVDLAARSHVGPAVRGFRRIPVTLVDDAVLRTHDEHE